MNPDLALRLLLSTVADVPELPPGHEWFSTRDLAVLLGHSRETVKGWRAQGLQLHPFGGRGWLYVSRADLEVWLAEHPSALSRREQRLRRLASQVDFALARAQRSAERRAAATPATLAVPPRPGGQR